MTAGYRKIDMEHWPRREHYAYYTTRLKVGFNMTARVRVDHVLDYCHRHGYRFYPVMICLVTRMLNQLDFFKMFRNAEGELCVWDHILPNYTFFHKDDETFSDCWSEYSPDFDTFYQTIVDDMARYQDQKGIKARPGQPGNFYCISCVPWVDFTGYSTGTSNTDPQFFPAITMGRYTEENGRITMPVNLMIAHAVCDGYHAGLFFNHLQSELDAFCQQDKA